MATRKIQERFDAYSESHQHPVNVNVHWICVPLIFFSVVALLHSIPAPWPGALAHVALLALMLYYLRLGSALILLGMLAWCSFCLLTAAIILRFSPWPLWAIATALFVLAWIGQFWGHQVEGKKPSFLDDLQFLLIGPAWLMAKLLDRAGLRY